MIAQLSLATSTEQLATCSDLLEYKRKQISDGIEQKKDEIIKMAINHYLAKHDWWITDIIGRCNMNIFPDKTEVFQMDGINLVEIYPVMFKTEEQDGITVLTAVQEYRQITWR